jgi:hypothetical protein
MTWEGSSTPAVSPAASLDKCPGHRGWILGCIHAVASLFSGSVVWSCWTSNGTERSRRAQPSDLVFWLVPHSKRRHSPRTQLRDNGRIAANNLHRRWRSSM